MGDVKAIFKLQDVNLSLIFEASLEFETKYFPRTPT